MTHPIEGRAHIHHQQFDLGVGTGRPGTPTRVGLAARCLRHVGQSQQVSTDRRLDVAGRVLLALGRASSQVCRGAAA